jgi:hypothetical protein
MTDTEKSPDPRTITGARRRFGFVAALWWIAAISGSIGIVQGLTAGYVRLIFVGISWVLALFFTYAWTQVRKGRISQ